MRKIKRPTLTVDGLIIKAEKVLLVKRAIKPFIGFWTLPGGHVEYGETVEKAIKREMKEELGSNIKIKKIIGVYSDPKRDPRYHTVAVAFLLDVGKTKISLDYEASEYCYFFLNKLPKKIGFDHRKIIKDFRALKI